MTLERVNIPAWAIRMFGVAQPVVVAFLVFVSSMLWSLNQQVTILNVKMETALETDDKLDTISERINGISSRVSRIEVIQERMGGREPEQ